MSALKLIQSIKAHCSKPHTYTHYKQSLGVHVQKTRQILCSVRKSVSSSSAQPGAASAFTAQLNSAIGAYGVKRDEGLAEQVAALAARRSAATTST
jgi:hypothetical protein